MYEILILCLSFEIIAIKVGQSVYRSVYDAYKSIYGYIELCTYTNLYSFFNLIRGAQAWFEGGVKNYSLLIGVVGT